MLTVVLVVAVATAVMCAAELLGVPYRRLARGRRGDTFRDLHAHFCREGVHVDVLLATQEFFQRHTAVRAFPVRPADRLASVYGMQQEDVRDAVVAIAAGARCLSPDLLAGLAEATPATVEELVYEVHRQFQQHQQSLVLDRRRSIRAV